MAAEDKGQSTVEDSDTEAETGNFDTPIRRRKNFSNEFNDLLRSCLNIGWSWVADVGDVRIVRVQMDFGFSFDATPTVDTVLYFRG